MWTGSLTAHQAMDGVEVLISKQLLLGSMVPPAMIHLLVAVVVDDSREYLVQLGAPGEQGWSRENPVGTVGRLEGGDSKRPPAPPVL